MVLNLTSHCTPSLPFSTANPIGLAVAQLAAPLIVTSVEKVPMMVGVYNMCCRTVWKYTLIIILNTFSIDIRIVAQIHSTVVLSIWLNTTILWNLPIMISGSTYTTPAPRHVYPRM